MKKKILIKPLSVNKVWQGRRFKTKDYKEYEENVLNLLKGVKKVNGFIEVIYRFYIKNFSMSDVGNFEKPLSDIIVKSGIISDDKYILKMTLEKFKSDKEYIEIEIKKLSM
ncbi:MAG: RusA family crossover junction endodeoxyribonuclease [Spirochaetia bacterium]|nr:RusA family crossover junction endodeoxyribonuclease [Spirochaetia bacterium]